MRRRNDRGWRLLLIAALVTGVACSEKDQPINTDIGTVRIFFGTTGLSQATALNLEALTAVQIEFLEAELRLADGRTFDLLAPPSAGGMADRCVWATSVASGAPGSNGGRCGSGLVFSLDEAPQNFVLALDFSLRAARPEPVEFPAPDGDFDGDGVPEVESALPPPPPLRGDDGGDGGEKPPPPGPCATGQWEAEMNCLDNCPFFPNTAQTDSNEDGLGDSCSQAISSDAVAVDSDSDGVRDGSDNCFQIANPLGENTVDVTDPDNLVPSVGDSIGDACVAQAANAATAGTVELVGGVFQVFSNAETNVVVDLNLPDSLSCDWTAGTCTIDAGAVSVCVKPGILGALGGC